MWEPSTTSTVISCTILCQIDLLYTHKLSYTWIGVTLYTIRPIILHRKHSKHPITIILSFNVIQSDYQMDFCIPVTVATLLLNRMYKNGLIDVTITEIIIKQQQQQQQQQ